MSLCQLFEVLEGKGKDWMLWGNDQVMANVHVKEDNALHYGLIEETLVEKA